MMMMMHIKHFFSVNNLTYTSHKMCHGAEEERLAKTNEVSTLQNILLFAVNLPLVARLEGRQHDIQIHTYKLHE